MHCWQPRPRFLRLLKQVARSQPPSSWPSPPAIVHPPLQVTTSINNLILGKIYIDHGGIMKVSGSCAGRGSTL